MAQGSFLVEKVSRRFDSLGAVGGRVGRAWLGAGEAANAKSRMVVVLAEVASAEFCCDADCNVSLRIIEQYASRGVAMTMFLIMVLA